MNVIAVIKNFFTNLDKKIYIYVLSGGLLIMTISFFSKCGNDGPTLRQEKKELYRELKESEKRIEQLYDEINRTRRSRSTIQAEISRSENIITSLETDLEKIRRENEETTIDVDDFSDDELIEFLTDRYN